MKAKKGSTAKKGKKLSGTKLNRGSKALQRDTGLLQRDTGLLQRGSGVDEAE
jgi:hypothetical protein